MRIAVCRTASDVSETLDRELWKTSSAVAELVLKLRTHQKQYKGKSKAEHEWSSQVGIVHDVRVHL
jgi:hypothetical protein